MSKAPSPTLSPNRGENPPIWSGENPIPDEGVIIGVPFGNQTIAGRMTGTFVEKGTKEYYTGIRAELLELPAKATTFGWANRLEKACREAGETGLLEFASQPECFCADIFGAEIAPTTPAAPKWFAEHGLGAREEFAAIVPSIIGDRDWKDELSITAWCQGQWHATAYAGLSGPLQRIRNTAHMEFVEAAVSKNKELRESCKSWLKARRLRGPEI